MVPLSQRSWDAEDGHFFSPVSIRFPPFLHISSLGAGLSHWPTTCCIRSPVSCLSITWSCVEFENSQLNSPSNSPSTSPNSFGRSMCRSVCSSFEALQVTWRDQRSTMCDRLHNSLWKVKTRVVYNRQPRQPGHLTCLEPLNPLNLCSEENLELSSWKLAATLSGSTAVLKKIWAEHSCATSDSFECRDRASAKSA